MSALDHPSLFEYAERLAKIDGRVIGITEGRARRDRGIRLIDTATRFDPWRGNAERAVRHRCDIGQVFSSNEIREDVGDPPRPNMWGSVFKWAEREGLVTWKGELTPSDKASAHGRMTRLWHPVRGAA